MSLVISKFACIRLLRAIRAWSKRRGAALIVAVVAAAAPADDPAQAEAATPWHPVAYAYLNAVFLLNLKPIDWTLVERVLTSRDGPGAGEPAADQLRALDAAAGTAYWPTIETALMAKRADALYAAATKAICGAIGQRLARARAALDQPDIASQAIDQAQALYRAFADFVRQTDPDGFRALGLAWLELASSTRQERVITVGDLPADAGAFETARAVVIDYLQRNYEPELSGPRPVYAPIPEERLRADTVIRVAPWLPPGSKLVDHDPLPRLVLNLEMQGIREQDVFMVAFGDMLFGSPEIFGEPASSLGISCATCHSRSDINRRFFIPGLSSQPGAVDVDTSFFNPLINDQRDDPLDIPSLRGLRFTGPYGRDGRFTGLRDLVRHVIVNDFAGEEPSPLILDALVAYMSEFDFLPARYLEADGRLKADVSGPARRGETLFKQPFAQMSGQSCATCHMPSSHFTDNLVHDIGSAGDGAASGFSGAFDTPTLLGVAHTAPYFHDGRFRTLAEVVAWFDERFQLDLGPDGRADLTAYLEAVGEGVEPNERPADSAARQGADGGRTVALSTLEMLLSERDGRHADLLLRTVASGMEQDADALSDRDARETAMARADALWRLRDLVKRDAWDEATAAWQADRTLAAAREPAAR